jgi:Zn-dependent protease with chaperone function
MILGLHFFIPIIPFLLGVFFTNIISNVQSRAQEFEADDYTVKYGYRKHMVSSLKKIESYVKLKLCDGISKKDCDYSNFL